MCRLLGYVAFEPTTFDRVVGDGFTNFVEMSREHKHGWGISTCSLDGDMALTRDLTLAAQSQKFAESIPSMISDGALLHLRLASKGLTVDIDNNHPFQKDGYSFMHNGTIRNYEKLEEFIDAKYSAKYLSSTDSERYFYLLLTFIDQYGLIDGVRKGVKTVAQNTDFSSINTMLLSEDKLIAVCEFNEGDQSEWTVNSHYELRYQNDGGVIKIASTGWGKDEWTAITNHHILVIDRRTLACEVSPL